MLEEKSAGLTKDTLFKKPLSRMEAKSAVTDQTARAILQHEKAVVDAKTERLKAARLERDRRDP
ncbi:hypothetical protein HGG72_19175 [Ochrobactrum pecoris]|uniref:Uncharacterized protein n=1 Tax=Brucella pecoris TaxID=867683 RepID=A0A5C5CWW5_9HYPH|nr:hypothetical protein [Brucella pecoris]MBB4092363.1 hypothetical protein [Brucella pecoris]NKW81959.1 hypothetical protein [Brucella pecoris]TNV15216.1 hypothetical protein FIB18_00190 [Brucella pecoris]